MTVELRGVAQGPLSPGSVVAWPAGTAAGDLAVLRVVTDGLTFGAPGVPGWISAMGGCWWKRLASADVAVPLPVSGVGFMLAVFSGAGSIGRTSAQSGLTVGVPGSAVWIVGSRAVSGVAPDTYRRAPEWVAADGWTYAQFVVPAAQGWVQLPGAPAESVFRSLEVVPIGAPLPPVVLSPAEGQHLGTSEPIRVSWVPDPRAPQAGWRAMVSYGGFSPRWVDATGHLIEVEQVIASDVSEVTVLPWQITLTDPGPDSVPVAVSVSTQTESGGWGAFAPVHVWVDRPPGVHDVEVAAPAEDLTPVVSWEAGAGFGSLTAWRVCLAPEGGGPLADPVWDSGIVQGSATSVAAPATAPWVNGQSLEAWVTVWQTGGVSARAVSPAFAVSWTAPAAPTVSVDADATPVAVTVTGLEVGDVVQLEQEIGGGAWDALTVITATASSVTVSSPLASAGLPVRFRARRAGGVLDGVALFSTWAVSDLVASSRAAGCMLVDDGDRTACLPVELLRDGDRSVMQGVSVSLGLGASSARIDMTPPAGQRGAIALRTMDEDSLAVLLEWLHARQVLWVVFPPDAGVPRRPIRVARSSSVRWERLFQRGVSGIRHVEFEWVSQP